MFFACIIAVDDLLETLQSLQALCGALFPRYARLVLQRLLEAVQVRAGRACFKGLLRGEKRRPQLQRPLRRNAHPECSTGEAAGSGGCLSPCALPARPPACLQRGEERYQQAAITGMRAIFQVQACLLSVFCRLAPLCSCGGDAALGKRLPVPQPCGCPLPCPHPCTPQVPALDLGPSGWPATDPGFAAQLSVHLGGALSGEVLAAFQAMLRFQGGGCLFMLLMLLLICIATPLF